jgi:hypothetical protein
MNSHSVCFFFFAVYGRIAAIGRLDLSMRLLAVTSAEVQAPITLSPP